ncbi:hypothetical protein OEZ86_013318 [Tetradesmus obliquus]|nr:hypothetical protein OEZ86_013318 [Tetradesmus obliquus]
MVVWKDGSGNWVVFEDRCPHRLAPLSEGRLEPSTGQLMCAYHGWQFDSQGKCTSIPQIGEPAAHAAACSSKRTCAITYPSQVAQGLLWVWPDAASSDLAAASPPALSSQWGAGGWTLLGGEWFARDLEYGYDTMMENLFDPSHIPFAHHGIMGSASRDKAQPLAITTKVDVTAQGGFQLFRDSAPFKTAAPTDTVNNFVPPTLNASSQTNTVKGTTLVLTFYGIPTAPGKSRVITAFFTNAKVPAFAAKLAAAVEWVFHLGQNQVLDSDGMLLHVQERLLHEGRDTNWRSAFYMPAGADLGIIKFRSWYHDCAGGSVPWPGALASQGLGPVLPRAVVMDRFSQHTQHCKSCSAAVKWIQRLQAVCLGFLKVAAENSSSSSSEESDAAKRARSNHGKQFEAKTRRRGRPAWMRSPYDSPLRDGNRDRLIGLLTERAAKTLMVYLMETNANVYSWLVNFYKQNPIPKDGSWDEISGEAFLRKLLAMPIEEAKYNTGRDELFDNVRSCDVDPRSIAQRVMDIRKQLAEEFIQELQQVAEENALLLRETLQSSLSTDVNKEQLPAAHAKLKPLAPSSSSSDASKPSERSNGSSSSSTNSRSKYKQPPPDRPKVSTPPQSWRRYRPPGSQDHSMAGSAAAGGAGDSSDKAAAVAALNAMFNKGSEAVPGSHPEVSGGGGAGGDDDSSSSSGAGGEEIDMREVIAQLQRSLDADVAQLTGWNAAGAAAAAGEDPSSSSKEDEAAAAAAAETAMQLQQEEETEDEQDGLVSMQEALTTAEADAAVSVLEAAAADALGDLDEAAAAPGQEDIMPQLEEAMAAVEAAAAAYLAAAAADAEQAAAADAEYRSASAAADEAAASGSDDDSSSVSAGRQPPLPKGWGPRAGVGFSKLSARNNILSVRQLTSKATPAASAVAAADAGAQQQ